MIKLVTNTAFICGNIEIDGQTGMYFLIIIGLLFIGGIIYTVIKTRKENKKVQDSWGNADPPITEYHVTVADMICDAESYGYAQPTLEKSFHVAFLTDNGEKLELEVDENIYISLNVGDSGMLAILNEKFYGFVPD